MSHDNIPTTEIQQDIQDTLAEIATMEREEVAFRMLRDRMSIFRADARRQGIVERRIFIAKLEAILTDRHVAQDDNAGSGE